MKSTAQKTTRATRSASHPSAGASRRTPPPASLAPRSDDAPKAEHIGHAIEASVHVELDTYDVDPSNPESIGMWSTLTWRARVECDGVVADGEDPLLGVTVTLSAETVSREQYPRYTNRPDHYSKAQLDLGDLRQLGVPAFRRMLAGLNALAAALPADPEARR